MTNWKGLGVVPWFESAWKLPAEDLLDIRSVKKKQTKFKVVCLCLSRMANFDDLDPISQEPDIDLVMLTRECDTRRCRFDYYTWYKIYHRGFKIFAAKVGSGSGWPYQPRWICAWNLRWLPNIGKTISDPEELRGRRKD